ncbi:MAG: trypsin-like peptidase domain-containing protein [Candidatus Moraniibacteriota bacterium]|nr:MAG: trypsin-like peptidase domain-containing protein [Candidatus Moranbacteria bacterium]
MSTNQKLLSAVRTVGILKPKFNPVAKGFDSPRLEVNGTGFWIDNGSFITCAHVVENLLNQPIEITGILVVGGNLKPYRKATVSVLDYKHDLAILNIEPNDDDDVKLLEHEVLEGLEICSEHLDVGEKIAYAGFPFGTQLLNEKHSPSYAEGVIGNDVNDEGAGFKTIQISGPIVGGYSGAPIVMRKNFQKVVGVVSHSPSLEVGPASIFRSIHWKHINELTELDKS